MKKTFEYDFRNKEFKIQSGKLIPTTDIKVWIEKILRTEMRRYIIYEGTRYGVSLEDVMIGKFPRAFSESEIRREIEEALLQNEDIQGIENFQIENKTIEFEVILVDGSRDTATITF